MSNNSIRNGLVVLMLGLLASSIASFLGDFMLLGSATNLAQGFFDGLAVVAFVVAIAVLVQGRAS